MLSGGERALTAVALLFAMLEVRPVPFCVLDEVDAALDEANVGRFVEALRGLAETTQFVVITHNRGTIEAADALYGVTVGDDAVSRVVSLRIEEATSIAERARPATAAGGAARLPGDPGRLEDGGRMFWRRRAREPDSARRRGARGRTPGRRPEAGTAPPAADVVQPPERTPAGRGSRRRREPPSPPARSRRATTTCRRGQAATPGAGAARDGEASTPASSGAAAASWPASGGSWAGATPTRRPGRRSRRP